MKNNVVLDALIDLNEEINVSYTVEVKTYEIVVLTKALANRFSPMLNIPIITPEDLK